MGHRARCRAVPARNRRRGGRCYPRPVAEFQLVIDEEPRGRGAKWHRALLGRRLLFAVLLAAAEAIVLLVFRPSLLWVILGGAVVLAACAGLLGRVPPGLGRDALIIVGGAQAILIAIPLAIGFGILVAVVVGILLIAGIVFVAFARKS